jgi:ATP-dependent helicase HepA
VTPGSPDARVRFKPGQRWISVSEPELGLGEVRTVGQRTVTLWFPAAREAREYVASGDIPVRRAAFRAGDRIATRLHTEAVVEAVNERDGLLYYTIGGQEYPEQDLSQTLSFSSPLERLFAGQFDESNVFDLRLDALRLQHRRRQSEVRGLVGGRIDLLPHQLGIASEVTGRLIPRVLLADEVGLGKTIEACLVLHRLLLTGRAKRAIIIVPESLVHQWFLELLRRFNLWFHIFNEARCVAIEENNPDANPFLDDQLLLCDLGLFLGNEERIAQAASAGWDVVVVDEAHHLAWSPAGASREYDVVERLARVAPGLLLLTATPEQLGIASHFARLRLLDAERFHSLEQFIAESRAYQPIAHLAGALISGRELNADEQRELAGILGEDHHAVSAALSAGDDAARRRWFERLLDQHGTGRVMFRNTRATISGFPRRIAHMHRLSATSPARFKALAAEWHADVGEAPDSHDPTLVLTHDPRIDWIVSLLQSLGGEKLLLICGTERRALAIESALRHRTNIPVAAFHEGLTLVQRDRAAASFADADGARLLVCSEIGSEGRNFQFAHHLVLFDLPLDPALVEQRIGRLDRIGQREEIHIHVPVIESSHLEVMARWYHDGLNAFEDHVPGARELADRFRDRLEDVGRRIHRDRKTIAVTLDEFVATVRDARAMVAARLEDGRDRLLEWNSYRPAVAERVAAAIREQDDDTSLDEFMLRVFDLFFIEVEEIASRTFRLGSAGVLVDEFPGLKSEGLIYTRDRARALLREDLQFLTWDHPLATGALDMLLGSEKGNCSFARWPDPEVSALYCEAVYVLECVAPPALHADRFLPPTPLLVVVDHRGRDGRSAVKFSSLAARARAAEGQALLGRAEVRDTLLPRMTERTRELAEEQTPPLIAAARELMAQRLSGEIDRLRQLQRVNRLVRDEEIALLVDQQAELDTHISNARLRLDSVRLIRRGR